jgi:hypothetical protein
MTMNWRRDLFRLWLVISLCWMAGVGLYGWKQERWVLASDQEFVFDPAFDLSRIKRNVERMTDQAAPESDIESYIRSEGATPDAVRAYRKTFFSQFTRRYAIYVLVPPLATLVLGLIGAWVVSAFERKRA